ncbi:MAG TPA: DnaA N-terminal domain-containing protein, partial [Anaerolineaceae bacterium]|nr:DnaA N-terminal domain-containing protein [Anaerolineaceae bacterium]
TIKRHLKMLTDTGYLVDRTPNLRNRPHIYQPGSKFTRQPAPEPILPDDDDDTEDIPPAGRSERTTSPETGRSERPTTRSERPTRWVTENYPGMAESTMSDTSLRDNRRNLKEDTDSPSSKAKKLWEPILQNLKSQASKSFYEEYLQPITPHSWDGTTLTLTVPDPGLAEIIQSRAGIQATRFLRAISANSDAGILILSPKPTHSASTDR